MGQRGDGQVGRQAEKLKHGPRCRHNRLCAKVKLASGKKGVRAHLPGQGAACRSMVACRSFLGLLLHARKT